MLKRSLSRKKSDKKISFYSVIIFFITLMLCFSLIIIMIFNRSSVEELKMEQLVLEKSIKINEVISKLLYKTQMLSSMVLQHNGEINNFDQIAATIVDDPAIMNILIAPSGVVSNVYPIEGNEAVIGLDFFSEGAGNLEAIMAKETGQLVLGGPFNAVQGGQVLVGRLPVYIDEADGSRSFWGLVSVTLKYPEALDGAGLNELKIQDFAFEIWRINPDNNDRQIISDSGHSYTKKTNYVEKRISIMNSEWYFRILPVKTWYQFLETWISIIISICVSLLVAIVTQDNQKLKSLKGELEILSNIDSLTGIYNRRYFMESVVKKIDEVNRMNSVSFIIIIDLDHFKNINDSYGHQTGDKVLKEIAANVARTLRPYDLFARYGGEEFIIFISDIDKESIMKLAERIRQSITMQPIDINGTLLNVYASLGVAKAAPDNDLETAIKLADNALYKAKEEGRNKVVFYGDSDL